MKSLLVHRSISQATRGMGDFRWCSIAAELQSPCCYVNSEEWIWRLQDWWLLSDKGIKAVLFVEFSLELAAWGACLLSTRRYWRVTLQAGERRVPFLPTNCHGCCQSSSWNRAGLSLHEIVLIALLWQNVYNLISSNSLRSQQSAIPLT